MTFLCDFAPFGYGLYRYTFRNESSIPPELIRLLKFVTANLEESGENFGAELVNRFQNAIRDIKKGRELGERYMILKNCDRGKAGRKN